MPRLTVVLPVYNHESYIQESLDGLFAQDYPDFAIVAVDDGSTDGSLEVLNRNRNRIQIIEGRHEGPAAARNIGLQAADSEFIVFMDADDRCAPGRLRLSVEKLETGNLDFIASALSFIDSSGQPMPGIWTRPPEAPNSFWGSLLERNWIGTPSVVVRRKALDRAGWFDDDFSNAEDYDLWLRIGAGHSIGFIDTPLIQCRRHEMNTSIDIEAHQNFERLALQKVDRRLARTAFNRLYNSEQRRAEAWIWFLLRSGDARFPEEAEAAVSRHPQSDSLRFARGVFEHDAGWYEDATKTFVALKTRDTAALHNIGVLLSRCGDYDAASPYLEAALRLRPDYYDARINLDAVRNRKYLRLTRRPFRSQLIAMTRS